MSSVSRKGENRILTPQIFQVQSIIQRGISGNQRFYLVKWKGYSEKQATWEPECNLAGCKQAILQFETIIQRMSLDKNKPQSAPEPTQKLKSKLTENQVMSSISQSKQSTKSKVNLQKSQNNKSQKSSKTVKNKEKNKELSRENEKKSEMEILTEKKSNHSSKEQSSSESDNNILEATTAQTIPTNRQTLQPQIIDKVQNKISEINLIDNISSQLLNKSVNQKNKNTIKVQNSSTAHQKVKKVNLKRSREEPEVSEKQICKPKKKNKKSPLEEIPKEIQKQSITIKTLTNENEIKSVFNENINNDFFNQILSTSKCEKKKQQQKLNQKQNPTKSINIMAEFEYEPHSQRYILCENEFLDLTTEFVGSLDKRLKSNSNIPDDEGDHVHTKRLRQRFVDLSSAEFSHLNEKVLKILLSKKEVQQMDQEGEFLFCKIQAMIKIKQQIDGNIRKQWVCVMKDSQNELNESKCIRLFVRIDDLKRDLWKKYFRKFTMCNFE